MNESDNVIVLNQIDYKDNDAIISVLTQNYGKFSFYVKGYKKITSKNVYACQLFDNSNFLFDLNESKNVQVLKSATLINDFSNIKADYDKMVIASIMCEILNSLDDNNLYNFALKSLQLLENTNEPILIYNLFIVQIMNLLGINAYVDGCVMCDDNKNIVTISIVDGGFVCNNCNKQIHLPHMDVELLRKFRVINKANYDVIDKLQGYNDYKLTELLMGVFTNYSGMNLISYKALEKSYKS